MGALEGLSIEMKNAVESVVNNELVEASVKFINEKIESAATKMAKKHIAKYEYLMDDSSVPSFIYDMNGMRTIEKETRQKMRQALVSMLGKNSEHHPGLSISDLEP